MCRYKSRDQLPPRASPEHVQAILNAIKSRQFKVIDVAARSAEYIWQIRIPVFIDAIRAHLAAGYLLYLKPVSNPPDHYILLEANVRLDPSSLDEADDVYVEIRLSKHGVYAYTGDSHPHFDTPRLPKL
jgi:hypothetical protein